MPHHFSIGVNIYARIQLFLILAFNCRYDPFYVFITLYNNLHPRGTTVLDPGNVPPTSKITLIIHGWSEDSTAQWVTNLRKAYTTTSKDPTVLVADYGAYSNRGYLEALCVTPKIGATIGEGLDRLAVDGRRVTCVGFSLGGQLCGFAARSLKGRRAGLMGVIVGLDVAGPGFDRSLFATLPKLTSDDASVVIGYYTSGNDLGFGALISKPYAHFNVLINGGVSQPGCVQTRHGSVFNNQDLKQAIFCNHIYVRRIKILSQLAASPINDYQATLCRTYEEYFRGECSTNDPVPLSSLENGLLPHGNYYFRTDKQFRQVF